MFSAAVPGSFAPVWCALTWKATTKVPGCFGALVSSINKGRPNTRKTALPPAFPVQTVVVEAPRSHAWCFSTAKVGITAKPDRLFFLLR